jgi:hypothetical protein
LPPRPELGLPELQRWMQAVIEQPGSVEEAVQAAPGRAELDPSDIGSVLLPSKTLTPVERIGVYQGMYLLRMVEALEGDYPAVAHFLGAGAFADLVTRYVAKNPSVTYTFNRLGDSFPEFVRASKQIPGRAFVADLARLERMVTEVFDAPQSPAWPAEDVARVREEDWPAARLQPIAAFRLGAFGYPVNAYLQSVKEDDHDHPETGRSRTFVAVWRKNYEVWRLNLSKPEHDFLKALAKGRPFGNAVADAAKSLQGDAGAQLFRWLRDWVAEGMFEGVRSSFFGV